MKFSSAIEMLLEVQEFDLYSPELLLYVFGYNSRGAIAVYNIPLKLACELEKESRETGEYWGAFLGPGGYIYDAPGDENFPPSEGNSNIEFCENVYGAEWIFTEDVIELRSDEASSV